MGWHLIWVTYMAGDWCLLSTGSSSEVALNMASPDSSIGIVELLTWWLASPRANVPWETSRGYIALKTMANQLPRCCVKMSQYNYILTISLYSLSHLENFIHYIFNFFSASAFSVLILRLNFVRVRPLNIISQALKQLIVSICLF